MSEPSQQPIKIQPRYEWEEKCKDCPVAGLLINQISHPRYSEGERTVIFHFIKDILEELTGQKFGK